MKLSKRQLEVLKRRASGMHFKEISSELGISLKTVEFHWAQIKARVGRQDVVAVCRWAWVRGIG